MVVVCDDEDRENEGDLTIAAQFATPEAINFMATRGPRADLPGADARALRRARPRPHGGQERVARFETPFTVSIEAREGVTTGISAHDRAHTIQVAIDPATTARATSSSPATCSR